VAEVKDLAKSYGPKQVFSNANFVIERGDRIALVGVNGAGKSTLIKLLAGFETPTAGELRLGHNVDVDYFAQDQYKALDTQARMLDDLFTAAPRSTQTELRSLLGCFLFSEDDVFKTIGVLSGGERNRYALARMLLHPSNFLLLDEPTNHLDLRAKDVLLDSLQKFTGTVVFVSHDRYFIDKLATRVIEIGGGQVEVFPGNYEDYLWRKEGKAEAAPDPALRTHPAAASAIQVSQPGSEANQPGVAQADPGGKQKRLNPIKLKQMKDRCQELEEEIARLEAAIASAETALQEFVSVEETQRQTVLLERSKSELDRTLAEWENLASVLETAE
jgi:ATP-binding cassette subfamily F protein 3